MNRPHASFLCRLALAFMAAFAVFAHTKVASAHSYHTPNVCSTTATEVCAHVGFDGQPNSKDETTFMLHFMPKSIDPKLITNVAVQTWMDMGAHSHPGAPVTVTQADAVHYEVTKVHFMEMSGPWQIKVSFDYNGARHLLVIPIEVL